MQRVGLPSLVWRLLEPPVAPTTPDTASAEPALPNWSVGQIITGQVLENLDGQVLVLIDGYRLRADWPGALQAPGMRVSLQVLGHKAGQWHLALITDEQTARPGATLLLLLEQLNWPLTYKNVERLARFFSGKPVMLEADEEISALASGELCPPNLDVWQQLFGYEPGLLAAAFFTWQPFTCGLFVGEQADKQGVNEQAGEPLSFVFVADLPRLGQVEVVGLGRWPEQAIVLVAQKETVMLLQKREQELIMLLRETGMQLTRLTLRATSKPLLNLLRSDMFAYRGVDRLM